MLLHDLKESLNLTYVGAIPRILLKTSAVVNMKRKRVTIVVATMSISVGQMDGILDTPVIRYSLW